MSSMLQDFRAVMVDDSGLDSKNNGVCVVQKVCNDGSLGRYFVMEIIDGEWFPLCQHHGITTGDAEHGAVLKK